MSRSVSTARVRSRTQPLRRYQRDLFLLYLSSLTGILLVMAIVVRGISRDGEWTGIREELTVVASELSQLPMPASATAASAQAIDRGFRQAHQQVEWFQAPGGGPLLRLGEPIRLAPLALPAPGATLLWQEGHTALALVRPLGGEQGKPGVRSRPTWLRVSTSLELMQQRLGHLDLALAAAVTVALLLCAVSAVVLTQAALRPLERHVDRLRQFSFDASHELRGPLAALAANIDMGLLEAPAEASNQRRRFEAMASAIDQMIQLVDDLLLVARHDGETIQHPSSVDLTRPLDQKVDLQRDGFTRDGLRLVTSLQEELFVNGQPVLLQRLFRNLLDNARRYTPRGGEIGLSAERRGGCAVVSVQDTGIGLRPEHMERVFDRLWRARPDRSGEGNGLGLAIASGICAAHGGRIEVSSEPGVGSCFRVFLPLQPSTLGPSASPP
ncbi:HAMP domain-containing sensor histidine kinase [Synechococcus sp. CS-1328]|uniref:sensor histidine kinase n=1 Tax=Synechococcus sp. CS-1328 TaxID=2847976 RepID=UPI00223B79C7|nr:HAMP domain-containing sensor histidine kinase [Synechococcus sp. CS-1328]MCT0226287.1 HAMP domain-containing histidine kinase [Synechococcus sp. CS-1328]